MEIRKRNTGIPIKEDPITSEHLDDRDEHRSRRNSINWLYLVVLSLGWVGVVHYFERIVPYRIIEKCQWKQWEKWPLDRYVHRIALLADPQIVDDYSYPKQFKFFNFFVRAGADNYLHRNFQIMQEILDPDTTIFLGDLFDGGRYWEDDQWIAELKRFNKVFPKRVNRRDIRSIPGNHDIGFQTIHKHIQDRFAQYFGDLNDYIELGNHTIVMFDSISLSHPNETILRESREFLESINQRINPAYPRIILTHVPLYRFPDSQLCGPLRESKKLFPLVRGDEYQTVIEYGFSQEILKAIQPEIIFAGDDHDYCDIIQHYQTLNGIDKQTREITMKSPAMTSGVRQPAIQLLSLSNPSGNIGSTFKTEMCYMPSPYAGLHTYLGLLLLSSIFVIAKTRGLSSPSSGITRHFNCTMTKYFVLNMFIPIIVLYIYYNAI